MQNSTLKKGLFVVIVTIVLGVIFYFLPYRAAY
jgi:preprotein translocase subunit SecE